MTDLDRLDALAAGLQKALAIGAISYDGDPWYAKNAGYDYDDATTALEVAPQMLDSLFAAARERDEMREDAEKWRAAEAEGHIVDFTEMGFGLQHPPSCRPNLIGCEFNQWLSRADGPDMEPGRYRMTLDPDMPEPWPQYAALGDKP